LAIVYVVAHLTTMAALAFQSNPVAGSSSTPMAGKPDWQQVERALLEAAKQSPDDFGAQQRLGELYLQQNRLSEGIVYLERAQRLNSQDYDSGYDLSLAYLNSGDPGKASTQLRRMIAQH
jgi:predicted Zn-dependent protease